MAQNTPNVPSSGNPIELSETDGSPRQNVPKKISPPMSPQNSQHTNSSSDCATQTRHPIAQNSDDQEFFKEMRGWLMIVAILAAGSTYQAGLNPPGGIWQDDYPGHRAGMPILHDKFFRRYQAFFYCNAISFLSSLVIIIFLMNKNFYLDRTRIKVLEITMVLDLFSFMAAYAVGSCRLVTSSIYVFLLMGGVFIYVISFARHYSLLQSIAEMMTCTKPCMQNTEQNQKSDLV
ncbi:Ankyrin repeat family protein [Rhynchospora pubera]|uniref:Ankyrin repeat family protein n=1 Tax=Rhynchospora pubera TaxID=906938 RepID=A0AAV8HP84_9POAL|nr:Ankyrin repeat family protein [Rhynchospora pubera]KAJ4763931.1 Ankyrin repeat family protein [Rhynchospora pubera]KAJ4792826.1 Ankyrin repeat family protein [Rhynchospora pubera]KAJ4816647.1 Ankyrin repeat family protein [Rhynchospora pubera]